MTLTKFFYISLPIKKNRNDYNLASNLQYISSKGELLPLNKIKLGLLIVFVKTTFHLIPLGQMV